MKKSLLAAVALIVMGQIAISQTWHLTNSGTNDWFCVASSANGRTLIAGQYPGFLGVSTNAGATWVTNAMMNGYWASVASSADGTKLMAAAEYEGSPMFSGIFLSTNSGASWISNNLPTMYWGSVAMSADCKIMAAVTPSDSNLSFGGSVFCSTNSGTTWKSNSLTFACSVAMSADGRGIFVVAPEKTSYSTNFGASWLLLTNAPTDYSYISPSQVIASSADGNRLIMSVSPSENQAFIYISTNSGNTWSLTSLPEMNWAFVASSANGQTLMASAGGFNPGASYISTNSGVSWTTNTSQSWGSVACSADGGALVGVAAPIANFSIANSAIYRSQFIQPPLLDVVPAGSRALLSWLIPSTNFLLERSFDFKNWSAVTNSPVLNPASLEDQILVSPTNDAGFYRLVNPGN